MLLAPERALALEDVVACSLRAQPACFALPWATTMAEEGNRDVEKCTFLGLQSIVIYGFFHGRFVHSTKRPWKKS